MKAEHRKELQTNILADRMGRMMQSLKERPKKRVFLYVILAAIVVVGLFIFSRIRAASAQEESDHWSWLEDSFQPEMDKLRKEYPETNAGKAARFQYAWLAIWDVGEKILGAEPVEALGNLEVAESLYLKLRKDCEGDPIWEPEALYGLAVIEETKAIRLKDREKHLSEALKMYKNLADKHKNSGRGKLAAQRAEALEKRGQEIHNFYDELNARLEVEKRFAENELKEKIKKKLAK
jgi:hypothetical protein